ncbi:hypothetical protein LSAT2_031384 [Lamellibrachia satsuma]|nr:hypothetical protein LSAT2_031384 [Lamellibrachia satsuma]
MQSSQTFAQTCKETRLQTTVMALGSHRGGITSGTVRDHVFERERRQSIAAGRAKTTLEHSGCGRSWRAISCFGRKVLQGMRCPRGVTFPKSPGMTFSINITRDSDTTRQLRYI